MIHAAAAPYGTSESHPSFLVLDRLHMDGEARASDDETAAARSHVEGCARCRSYLAVLDETAARPIPTWVRERETARPWQRLRSFFWRPLALAPALGTAALVLVGVALRPGPRSLVLERPAVVAKGGPSVRVYVKRGEHVALWDGSAPLYPRDRIRVEVAGAGFHQVAVASPRGDGAGLKVLYSGPLRLDAPTQLPISWTLDQSRGTETLYVVLSEQQLPSALELAQLTQSPQVLLRTLVFHKEEAR